MALYYREFQSFRTEIMQNLIDILGEENAYTTLQLGLLSISASVITGNNLLYLVVFYALCFMWMKTDNHDGAFYKSIEEILVYLHCKKAGICTFMFLQLWMLQ